MREKENSVKRCKVCGAPLKLGKECEWSLNGTISMRGMLLFFLERDFLGFFYSNSEKSLGLPIKKIIVESGKNITSEVLDKVLFGLKPFLKRRFFFNFFRKNLEKKLFDYFRLIGYGNIWLESMKWRKKAIIKGENVFQGTQIGMASLLAGGVRGLWNIPVNVNWEREKEITTIIITAKKKKAEASKYLTSLTSPVLKGNIIYEKCPRCGVPKRISENFWWDWEEGIITHKKTGKRWGLVSSSLFNGVFALVEKQLGEEFSKIVIRIAKEYTKKNFSSDLKGTEENYRSFFNPQDWGVKGWGNPVKVEKKSKELKVRIDSPFNELLIAGIVSGIYEKIEEVDSQVQWLPNTEGHTIITVRPK